jgi:hypothetical protein
MAVVVVLLLPWLPDILADGNGIILCCRVDASCYNHTYSYSDEAKSPAITFLHAIAYSKRLPWSAQQQPKYPPLFGITTRCKMWRTWFILGCEWNLEPKLGMWIHDMVESNTLHEKDHIR